MGEVDSLALTNLFILVTNRCNLSCRHCYVSSSPQGMHGLSYEQILNACNDFEALFGRQRLTLSGGEYFARKDLFGGIDTLASIHNVFILTNGTLISKEIASRIRDLPVALRFGIDGVDAHTHDAMRGHGSFDRMRRGLEALLSNGIKASRIELFFTATPENLLDVPLMLEFAEHYSLERLVVEPIAVHGRAAETWSKTASNGVDQFRSDFDCLIQSLARKGFDERWAWRSLRTDFTTLTVYFDGRVFPFTPADALDEQLALLGNINHADLRGLLDPLSYRHKVLGKAMRHMRSAAATQGPFRFWRAGYGDDICYD
jgi:sulfatase maturation enzyme AslB (radical SAM superfamily)